MVERVVERTVMVTVHIPMRAPAPPAPRAGRRAPTRVADWSELLAELTKQIDSGRVYARDLDRLAVAVDAVQHAVSRRRRTYQ